MAWGSLSASQWVSFTDIQGAGFVLKPGQSHTTSDFWMTKSEVIAKYYVNEAKASLVAKSSSQWVEKQDLETGDPATATLTIRHERGQWFGELSAAIPSTDIYIAAGVARGFYDACLGAADETVDMWIDFGKVTQNGFYVYKGTTINPGYTPYEQMSVSVINYNMIDNVEINGVARTDGSTFTIGGTTVTLSLPLSCTPYA